MNPLPDVRVLVGDCRETLKTLAAGSVQTCVTSPPYWGLRDYGHEDQIGQEATPEAFVETMVQVFREVWRALKPDGTLWLNLGDTYASAWPCNRRNIVGAGSLENGRRENRPSRMPKGLKEKDLCGIPWRTAFALQADGWYLRSDIIWHKPNPMPESVTDRPTKAHEYIFLLSKAERYYYDQEAILEPVSKGTHARMSQNVQAQIGSDRANGGGGAKTNGNMKAVARGVSPKALVNSPGCKQNASFSEAVALPVLQRNKRSVWTVPTFGFSEAHFATFPPDLIKPCIMAGCRPGDTVLDPFGGSGTTGAVSIGLGRNAILCELNPEYAKLIDRRTETTIGLGI